MHFQFALSHVIIVSVMIMANTIDKNRRPGGKSENQKFKSLLVEKVLLHETDEEHALSSTDIIAHLGLYGIDAERHGVARGIVAYGVAIIAYTHKCQLRKSLTESKLLLQFLYPQVDIEELAFGTPRLGNP